MSITAILDFLSIVESWLFGSSSRDVHVLLTVRNFCTVASVSHFFPFNLSFQSPVVSFTWLWCTRCYTTGAGPSPVWRGRWGPGGRCRRRARCRSSSRAPRTGRPSRRGGPTGIRYIFDIYLIYIWYIFNKISYIFCIYFWYLVFGIWFDFDLLVRL